MLYDVLKSDLNNNTKLYLIEDFDKVLSLDLLKKEEIDNELIDYINKKIEERKEAKLTQSELAEKLNISFQSVSKWETGETLPDTNILLSLCDELGTTADALLNGGTIINKNQG